MWSKIFSEQDLHPDSQPCLSMLSRLGQGLFYVNKLNPFPGNKKFIQYGWIGWYMKGTAPEKIILIIQQERQHRQTVENKKLKGKGKADSKRMNARRMCIWCVISTLLLRQRGKDVTCCFPLGKRAYHTSHPPAKDGYPQRPHIPPDYR